MGEYKRRSSYYTEHQTRRNRAWCGARAGGYNARVRLLHAAALLLLLSALACSPQEPGPPLLWSVQPPGGASTSYLLGTMHIGVSARDDLPGSVWEAFDGAGRLVEEAEISFRYSCWSRTSGSTW